MPWSLIKSTEVDFTTAESSALNAILGPGGGNKLGDILTRTVKAMRGSILAGGNQVGPVDTIPDQLRQDVIDIARWKYLIAAPENKAMQTAERKQAYDDAMKRLDKIASGDLKIEVPAAPLATTNPVTMPSICHKHHDFSKRDQEGI